MIEVSPASTAIMVAEEFANRPDTLWRALTTGSLIERWMGMAPVGFDAAVGNRFTFQTSPAGAWDGIIHCEVIEMVPKERFAYSWRGGDDGNEGYGSSLDTTVTFTLTPNGDGVRLEVVHSGFRLPRNATAHANMSRGWIQCASNLHEIANDL